MSTYLWHIYRKKQTIRHISDSPHHCKRPVVTYRSLCLVCVTQVSQRKLKRSHRFGTVQKWHHFRETEFICRFGAFGPRNLFNKATSIGGRRSITHDDSYRQAVAILLSINTQYKRAIEHFVRENNLSV